MGGGLGQVREGYQGILPSLQCNALALTPSRVRLLPPYSEFSHVLCRGVSNCAWDTLSSLRAANMHLGTSHQQLQAMRKRRLFKRRLPLERPAPFFSSYHSPPTPHKIEAQLDGLFFGFLIIKSTHLTLQTHTTSSLVIAILPCNLLSPKEEICCSP